MNKATALFLLTLWTAASHAQLMFPENGAPPAAEVPPPPAPPPTDIPVEVMEKVDPSVVSIQHEKAVGTGFILSEDGLILTNGHVVRGDNSELPMESAKRITVILHNDRKYSAKVLGFSMDPDVALLKIEPENPLRPVEIGDSRGVEVGQRCFAVGTPVGLRRTFTSGILSNVDRTDLNTETVVFQTDAAINTGNSGGPLFDRQGRVLGINTYASRGQNNLGFTIPIHVALDMVDHLKTRGRFVRTLIPLFFTSELYDELARALKIETGILVTYVMEDSAAERMGLRGGDILVAVDGNPVSALTKAELLNFEWTQTIRKPGEETVFTVLRGEPGHRESLDLRGMLEELPPMPAFSRHAGELVEHRYDILGLGAEALTDLHHIVRGTPRLQQGVILKNVPEGSVSARADLKENDVITRIDGKAVESIRDFRELLDAALARGEAAISVELVRGRMVMVTAIAPDYQMRNRKVLLVAPAGEQPNVDLLRRELLAKGAKVMLATPGGAEILRPDLGVPLTADHDLDNLDPDLEMDVLLIAGGEGAVAFREHAALLTLIRGVLADDNRVLACAGESALLPLLASEEKLSSKITLPSDLSGEAVRRGANYTGKDVETEKKIVTTTGADREILRQFLRSVANQH